MRAGAGKAGKVTKPLQHNVIPGLCGGHGLGAPDEGRGGGPP